MANVSLMTALVLAAAVPIALAQDLPAIRERGALRVVIPPEDKPHIISLAPGTPPGMERELIEGFAALQRLRVEFVRAPSGDSRIPMLLSGKGDIAIALINTEARRKLVAFTAEVFPARHVALTRRPHPPIRTLEELRRTRVGTGNGTSGAETAVVAGVPRRNHDDSFANAKAAVDALRQQRVGAVIMAVNGALTEKEHDPEIELGLFVGPAQSAAFAVRPDAQELHAALDEYIINVRRTPTWSRLVVKYYGNGALEVLQKSRENP